MKKPVSVPDVRMAVACLETVTFFIPQLGGISSFELKQFVRP